MPSSYFHSVLSSLSILLSVWLFILKAVSTEIIKTQIWEEEEKESICLLLFHVLFHFSETPEREENDYTSTKQTETAELFDISPADIERSKADYKCTLFF